MTPGTSAQRLPLTRQPTGTRWVALSGAHASAGLLALEWRRCFLQMPTTRSFKILHNGFCMAHVPCSGWQSFCMGRQPQTRIPSAFEQTLQVDYADGDAEEVLLAAERVRLRMAPGEAVPPSAAAELAAAAAALRAAAGAAAGDSAKALQQRAAQADGAYAAALQRQVDSVVAPQQQPPPPQLAGRTQQAEATQPAAAQQVQPKQSIGRQCDGDGAGDAQPGSLSGGGSSSARLPDAAAAALPAAAAALRQRPSGCGRRGFAVRKKGGGDALTVAELQPGDLVWAQVREPHQRCTDGTAGHFSNAATHV